MYRNKIDDISFNNAKYNGYTYFDTNPNRNTLQRNGQLVIELKIYFEVDNTRTVLGPFADNFNRSFQTDVWPAHILENFKRMYLMTGQLFWDNKFILTNREYGGFDLFFNCDKNGRLTDITKFEMPIFITTPTLVDGVMTSPETYNWQMQHTISFADDPSPLIISVHPDVDCRFRLKLVNTPGEAHKTIKLIYNSHYKERGVWHSIGSLSPSYFRSNASNYSQSDIFSETSYFNGVSIVQNTHIHEIGHAIGLNHSGQAMNEAQCLARVAVGDGNNTVCYGSTFVSASNIMGRGNRLLPVNAEPWRHAINLMTKSNTWHVRLR